MAPRRLAKCEVACNIIITGTRFSPEVAVPAEDRAECQGQSSVGRFGRRSLTEGPAERHLLAGVYRWLTH